jgi:hypothetical protein
MFVIMFVMAESSSIFLRVEFALGAALEHGRQQRPGARQIHASTRDSRAMEIGRSRRHIRKT